MTSEVHHTYRALMCVRSTLRRFGSPSVPASSPDVAMTAQSVSSVGQEVSNARLCRFGLPSVPELPVDFDMAARQRRRTLTHNSTVSIVPSFLLHSMKDAEGPTIKVLKRGVSGLAPSRPSVGRLALSPRLEFTTSWRSRDFLRAFDLPFQDRPKSSRSGTPVSLSARLYRLMRAGHLVPGPGLLPSAQPHHPAAHSNPPPPPAGKNFSSPVSFRIQFAPTRSSCAHGRAR